MLTDTTDRVWFSCPLHHPDNPGACTGKRIWKEVVQADIKNLKIIKEDTLVHSNLRQVIREVLENDSADGVGLLTASSTA